MYIQIQLLFIINFIKFIINIIIFIINLIKTKQKEMLILKIKK
jgi:hypothetical protein